MDSSFCEKSKEVGTQIGLTYIGIFLLVFGGAAVYFISWVICGGLIAIANDLAGSPLSAWLLSYVSMMVAALVAAAFVRFCLVRQRIERNQPH